MGIYDRDYYRREGPSFLGSIADRGQVCKWLIGINILVFIIQLMDARGMFGTRGAFTDIFELRSGAYASRSSEAGPERLPFNPETAPDSPEAMRQVQEMILHGFAQREANRPGVLQGQIWRLLTYAFLHSPADVMHILFNMLFLWWFGKEMEELYGRTEFLIFYLLAAVIAGLAFVLAQLAGPQFGGVGPCIGASGAVTAALVLCALHYPRQVILLFFLLPVPIWVFVAYQVLKDSFVFLSGIQNGTAVTAHLGGAAFAFLYYKRHWRLLNLLPEWRTWLKQRSRPRLRVYREEPPSPVSVPAPPAADGDEHLEAKLDAVLAKVARSGQSSLTEGERQILLRASDVYKRRRT